MGVIVRSPELYGAPLRATFERFGIPARFFFERPLLEVASSAYCAGAVEALLSGWDFERTLQWLRSAEVALGPSIDAFDFAVRRAMPGHGLDGLRQLAGEHAGLLRLFDSAQDIESWREGKASAREWGLRLASVAAMYRPARPFAAPHHDDTRDWREQAAALTGFTEAMEQTSACFPPDARLGLAEFWRAASAVLRLAMHRVDDVRRNVVNVLTAFEARQWRLPIVFICGLVEKQFPKYQPQNPFFPDVARRALKQAGLRLRASEDVDQEEAFLFESAVTRASATLVLSYPKADARGEQNLRSLYLDRLAPPPPVPVRSVRPDINVPRIPRAAVRIAAPERLVRLQTRHVAMKPTALEQFAQCPFQFFANQTLRLQAAPPRPEERLDFLFRGNVVHRVIGEWTAQRQPLEPLFERIFDEVALQNGIVPGYRTETIRQALLDDLRRFIDDDQWPQGFETQIEVDFRYELAPGLEVRGRIDRLDRSPDGRAYIVDYKYSKKDYTKNELLLQGPLYLLAAERYFHLQPGAMYYCGVRDRVKYSGWCDETAPVAVQPITPEWMEAAIATTMQAAAEIRAGRIEPRPADPDACRYCDFKDVCRIDVVAASTLAEGA
jgi:RecB family exonuclease